jgi:hypothetical protein
MRIRLLPAALCLGLCLWTVNSLINFGRMLRPQETEAKYLISALLEGDSTALPRLAASHPEALTLELMRALATHPDARLRELTAHQDWTPHVSLKEQMQVVRGLEPEAARTRATLWLTHRATSQNTLTLSELETYWSSKQ